MVEYINNKEFENLVYRYKKDDIGKKETEARLFSLFELLIDNIITSFNFQVERDDAKQECLLHILKVLPNFKEESGSAFNYFTTIIINNLRLIYSKNKIYEEKLQKYFKSKEHLKDLLE